MFLVGTAMLMFGFGLYAMFVGSKTMKEKGPRLSGSNLFGLFYMKVCICIFQQKRHSSFFFFLSFWFCRLKLCVRMCVYYIYLYIILLHETCFQTLPAWVEMQSVSQAKSKLGHTVMMILQVGVLEKFKNIPLVTGLDLACFAGAVFISSACIFVLSRLSVTTRDG